MSFGTFEILAARDWLMLVRLVRDLIDSRIDVSWPDLSPATGSPEQVSHWLRENSELVAAPANHRIVRSLFAIRECQSLPQLPTATLGPETCFGVWEAALQPIADMELPKSTRRAEPTNRRTLRQPTVVLCVEDDPEWQGFVRRVVHLQYPGASFELAADHETATATIKALATRYEYDDVVVVLDLGIPQRQDCDPSRLVGFELLRWLRGGIDEGAKEASRRRKPYRTWPVVILSQAADSLADHRTASDYGVEAYLPKTLRHEDLANALEHAVDSRPYEVSLEEGNVVTIDGLRCHVTPRCHQLLEVMTDPTADGKGTAEHWAAELWDRVQGGRFAGPALTLVHQWRLAKGASSDELTAAKRLLHVHRNLIDQFDLPYEATALVAQLNTRFSPQPPPYEARAFDDALLDLKADLRNEFNRHQRHFDWTRLIGLEGGSSEPDDDSDEIESATLIYWARATAGESQRPGRSERNDPFRVLVIDDDSDFRASVVGVLKSARYVARDCDFPDGWPDDGKWRPDAICLDLANKSDREKAGIHWLERHRRRIGVTPVIVLSSIAGLDMVRHRLTSEFNIRVRNFLEKDPDTWQVELLWRLYGLEQERRVGSMLALDMEGWPVTLVRDGEPPFGGWSILHPNGSPVEVFRSKKKQALIDVLAASVMFPVSMESCGRAVYGDEWSDSMRNSLAQVVGDCKADLAKREIDSRTLIKSSSAGYSLHARVLSE